MRVAIVSPNDPWPAEKRAEKAFRGGVEVALAQEAEALARRGHDVTVYTTGRGGDEERAGVRIVRERRFGTLFRNPLSLLPMRTLVGHDVVHAPATYPGYSDVLLERTRARGVPVVLDYHFSPEGTSALSRAAIEVYRATLARLMRRAPLILVKSRAYARRAPELAGVPASRMRVVPNGVDLARFRLAPNLSPTSFESRENQVLLVGRLVPYKGADVLVEAMRRVHAATGARLVVAGDGPLRPRLERRARDVGIDAAFLGYVADEELAGLYAASRVTVLPSVNRQEAFGMTLLESMACGTPVVASALPGVREVARLGGLSARPGDPKSLARSVTRVLAGEAPRLSPQDLRARVAATYSWGAVAIQLEDAYREAQALARGDPPASVREAPRKQEALA